MVPRLPEARVTGGLAADPRIQPSAKQALGSGVDRVFGHYALRTFETMVNLIGATRTRSGLQVKAILDTHPYEKGVNVSTAQFNDLHRRGHTIPPDWHYTLVPRFAIPS